MLTSKQKKFLRSQSNQLKPLVHIGKNGLNESIITDIKQIISTRELIKVNLLQNTEIEVADAVRELPEAIPNLVVIQTLGRVLTLYQPASKIKNRKLSLKVNDIK